jgi:hypothetical protein
MLISVRLEIVLILIQDRHTFCVECAIGWKNVLHALDGTPRSHGSCGISLLLVWREC